MHCTWRSFRSAAAAGVLISFICALTASVRPAAAQPAPQTRGFVTINGGLQLASADFSDNITFDNPLFGPETGDFDVRYGGGGDTVIDVGGGVRLWNNLAVGGGLSIFSHEDGATITGRLPHPFFFDRPRQIDGAETGFARRETAVHLQALWMIPASRSVDVALFGGPTFFTVSQDLVTAIRFEQGYPYAEAAYSGVDRRDQSISTTGFNVGADVAIYFSDRIGVGGTIRFSRGSVDLASEDGGAVSIETGGLHTTGGLRLRF